jgi:gas vesicle protein
MSSGKVLLGVLAGVAAGALLGILFAQDKGSNTRKKIIKKSEDYVGSVKDNFNDLLENVSKKFDEVKEEVTDFVEQKNTKPEGTKKGAKTTAG